MLFVAIILDPRTKFDSIDFWFEQVLNAEQATHMVTQLRHHINNLYDQYNNIGGSSYYVIGGVHIMFKRVVNY